MCSVLVRSIITISNSLAMCENMWFILRHFIWYIYSILTEQGLARINCFSESLRELAYDEGGAIEKDKETFIVLTSDMLMSCSGPNRYVFICLSLLCKTRDRLLLIINYRSQVSLLCTILHWKSQDQSERQPTYYFSSHIQAATRFIDIPRFI